MKRSIICTVLFFLAGLFYLLAGLKGNIPLYIIFGILLVLLGGLYVKRALTEKKNEVKEAKISVPKVKTEKVKKAEKTKKQENKKDKK